jgi:predicted Zn finger-like uncharacterized protein
MTIRVSCPGCKTAYAVPDEHRGKKLRCKKCQQVFRIESAAVPKPQPVAAAAAPESDFESMTADESPTRGSRPRQSGISPILIIAGVAAVVFVLGGGAVAAYFLFKEPPAMASKTGGGPAADGNPADAATPKGDLVAQNDPAKGAKTASTSSKIDPAYLIDDFFVALVVQPGRLAKSPALAGLPLEKVFGDITKQTGFDPRKISSAIVVMDPGPKMQTGPHSPSVIVRLQESFDGKKLLEPLMGPFTEKKHEGKTYFSTRTVSSVYLPDNRTIIVAPEATLLKMMAASKGGAGPMAKKLAQLDLNNDVLGVFLTQPARALLGDAMKDVPKDLPPQFAGVTTMPDKIDAAVLKLNLTGDLLLDVRFEAKTAEAAAELQKILQSGVEMLTGFAPLFQQGIQKDAPPPLAPLLVNLLDQIVKGIQVKSEGNQVALTVKMPQGLAELVTKVGPLLMEQAMGGGSKPLTPPPSLDKKALEKPGAPTKDPGRPPFEKAPPKDPGRPPFEKSPPSKDTTKKA